MQHLTQCFDCGEVVSRCPAVAFGHLGGGLSRKIPSRSVSKGRWEGCLRDYSTLLLGACSISVNKRTLPYRTATVWKTLSPFWGEEYEVHLPPSFHNVSFYVMDEDALRYGTNSFGS